MSAPAMCTCSHHAAFHNIRHVGTSACTRTGCDCTQYVARDDLDTLAQVIS